MDVERLSFGLAARDWPDPRDWHLDVYAHERFLGNGVDALPNTWRRMPELLPPVMDQGQLGSCGLHAGNFGTGALQIHRTGEFNMLSRLQWYYCTRLQMRKTNPNLDISKDTGITFREMLKAMKLWGVAPEWLWSYNEDFRDEPGPSVYAAAANYQGLRFLKLPEPEKEGVAAIERIKRFLYEAEGAVPIFGMAVYNRSFRDAANTGMLSMPSVFDRLLGGHAVGMFGWQDDLLGIRNSHGTDFGGRRDGLIGGEFYMPVEYAVKYTWDWWAIVDIEHLDEKVGKV